jgi:pyruvate formate lyase activating enzyme
MASSTQSSTHPDDAPSGVAVFNIQRCSIHDGPGIRTTVFIKGCPLRCDWCHNPESLDGNPEVAISEEKCVACGACVDACPVADGDRPARGPEWDDGTCLRCGACAQVCPGEARELIGEARAVADLVAEIERDRPFFEASGGGVTFSGGEPLCYPRFLAACLEGCRDRGLHTAVDTSGFASAAVIREVAELADVVLYDLKHMDPVAHERHTGAENRRILDNLRQLSADDASIWLRFPLIPGFNDADENLDEMGRFIASLTNRHPLFILPYHATGVDKHRRFGRPEPDVRYRSPTAAEVRTVIDRLRGHGIEVHNGGADARSS